MFKKDNNILIQFNKVSFGYEPNKPILNDVSFSIKKNEHVCIIGANGCGKSTVAKILVGLFKPRSGSIIYNNETITKKNALKLKQATGIVFENPDNQFIGLSVEDDISFGLENQCVPHDRMQSIIDETVKYVGISDLLKSSVNSLSGGQKQLVAISSVLAMNHEVIVFDEATSMLDGKSKNKIQQLMLSLKADKKKTIIDITHDMNEAALADRIIVMDKGQIVLDGTPNEVFGSSKIKDLSLDIPYDLKLKQLFPRGVDYEK